MRQVQKNIWHHKGNPEPLPHLVGWLVECVFHAEHVHILMSTQIRTCPFYLSTGTIPAHHGVGASTSRILRSLVSQSNPSLALSRRAIGTRLGEGVL